MNLPNLRQKTLFQPRNSPHTRLFEQQQIECDNPKTSVAFRDTSNYQMPGDFSKYPKHFHLYYPFPAFFPEFCLIR